MNFGERKDLLHKGEKVNADWDLSDSINYNNCKKFYVNIKSKLFISGSP